MAEYYLSSCDYGWGGQDDDPYDGGWWPKKGKVIKCNKCGSTDVVWKQVPSGKWCLHTNGEPHVCKKKETGTNAVPRTGKNSNKKELTGYKLVANKCCSTCDNYSCEKDAELCLEHDYFVVSYGYCNDWTDTTNHIISVKPHMSTSKSASAISSGIEPIYSTRYEGRKQSISKPREQSIQEQYNNAKICPYCHDRAGFSFGTGDCGCESSPEVGW